MVISICLKLSFSFAGFLIVKLVTPFYIIDLYFTYLWIIGTYFTLIEITGTDLI